MERITLCNNSDWNKSVDAITILVVDDDTTCLSIVAAILKKFRYEVVTVKHANDALSTLRIKEFDLVVSDVHMPDMNGFELQQAIAQEFNNLPVVLMSADDEEGVALKGLEKGAAFFILKPVSPDDVKDLWQFASMKKTNSPSVVIEETTESAADHQMVSKDSKRKSPQKEEEKGDNSQSASTKKPKVIWTNSLHNRFLEAIRSIGLDRAVPKKILEVMDVPGLTRENVASHLQKYRIFLRRVSDASYKIQASGESSSRITSPTPTLITKFNLNQFGTSDHSYSFSNLETRNIATHSGIGQSRLLNSNRGWSWPPNTGILQNRLTQNDYHTPGPLSSFTLEDVPFDTNFPASYNNHAPIISQNNELNSYKTNYVGYSIASIQKLTGFRRSEKNVVNDDDVGFNSTNLGGINQIDQMPNDGQMNNVLGGADGLLEDMINNCGQELSCDDYGIMMNNSCGVENALGGADLQLQFEKCFSPIFDISDLDIMMCNAHQQPLEIEEDFGAAFFPNDILNNIQNDLPQQKVGSHETSTNSNFYCDISQWDNPLLTFDSSQNQNQNSQGVLLSSQGFGNSSNLSETMLPPINTNQNSQACLMSTQGFGNSPHLSETALPPINTNHNSQGGLMSIQGFGISSHLSETMLPPINTHQNSQGGLMCSQGFGNSSHLTETELPPINTAQVYEELSSPPAFCTSSQLMTKTVQPLTERDDDEFLESLLAPFGEDQTLAGLI